MYRAVARRRYGESDKEGQKEDEDWSDEIRIGERVLIVVICAAGRTSAREFATSLAEGLATL